LNIEQFSKDEQERTQPFLVFLGNIYDCSVTQTFFMMERQLFEGSTVLDTLDKCFKFSSILHLSYATQCQQVWKFIGNIGYGIFEDNELLPTSIELKNFIDSHS
jgi:hypothetical protein